MALLHVAEAARRAGMNASAVRYYERRGLLPRAARGPSGYRMLGEETVERLRFIRRAQALGLRLEEIREILGLRDHGETPCPRVSELATERLHEIDEKMRELRSFRRSLARLVDQAKGKPKSSGHYCPLIESAPPRRRRKNRDSERRSDQIDGEGRRPRTRNSSRGKRSDSRAK